MFGRAPKIDAKKLLLIAWSNTHSFCLYLYLLQHFGPPVSNIIYINLWFFLFARYLSFFKNKFDDVWTMCVDFFFRLCRLYNPNRRNSFFSLLAIAFTTLLFSSFDREIFCFCLFLFNSSLFHEHWGYLFLNFSPALYNSEMMMTNRVVGHFSFLFSPKIVVMKWFLGIETNVNCQVPKRKPILMTLKSKFLYHTIEKWMMNSNFHRIFQFIYLKLIKI